MRVLLALLLIAITGCGGEDNSPDDVATPSSSAVTPVKAENAEAGAPKTKPGSESNVPGGMEATNSIGMKLRLIPAGEFMMGSPETESDRIDNETQHRVSITKPFYLGVTEVTQEQYQKVMGTNPSEFKGPQNPVEQVRWADAVEFCRKLSVMPAEKTAGHVYRLPTEAEWEYACRARTTTAYGFGDDASGLGDYGWFESNSKSKTHPVGEKKPNAWGLYDMHGNVYEWCQDWYGAYPSGSATDPTGATSGSIRVCRGGGWFIYARFCRSAIRNGVPPEDRNNYLGFRVLRSSIGGAAGTKPKPKSAPGSEPKADKPPAQVTVADAIAALKKLRATIKQNEQGEVVEVDFHFTDITDAGLVHLKGLPNLQKLSLFRTKVTDAGLVHLKGLSSLQTLDLRGTKITDAGLVHLKGLTKLQTLNLSFTGITDAGLVHLKGLRLTSLSIPDGAKTELGLTHYLAALETHTALNLVRWRITDAGLVHLKGLSGLQTLNLLGTKITDAGLVHLKGMTQLRSLNLGGTKITDAGLVHLKGLANLETLELYETKVTDAGVADLQKSLANCEIVNY